MQQQNSAL